MKTAFAGVTLYNLWVSIGLVRLYRGTDSTILSEAKSGASPAQEKKSRYTQ